MSLCQIWTEDPEDRLFHNTAHSLDQYSILKYNVCMEMRKYGKYQIRPRLTYSPGQTLINSRANRYEPVHEKTNNLGFRPGTTQTGLYSHRRWLEAGNFGFGNKRNCTTHVAKTKALISCAVTAKLICAFVFAYADCWFSHAVAHILLLYHKLSLFLLHY